MHQNHPVEDTEAGVADDEGQQVVPDQLENRPFPDHHQVDEALAPLAGVPVAVGVDVARHGLVLSFILLGRDCSSAGEHTLRDQEAVGSIPAVCWAFSLSSYLPRSVFLTIRAVHRVSLRNCMRPNRLNTLAQNWR